MSSGAAIIATQQLHRQRRRRARPPCGCRSSARPCRTPRRAGRSAAAPSASTLGRARPARRRRRAPSRPRPPRGVRSPSTRGDSRAVRIGLVNWIAVASASGIAITAMKKQIVASATAAPRPNCSQGLRHRRSRARPCVAATTSREPERAEACSAAPPPPSPARRRPSIFTTASPTDSDTKAAQREQQGGCGRWLGGHRPPFAARLGNCQSFRLIHPARAGNSERRVTRFATA